MDAHSLGDHAHHSTQDGAPKVAERRTRWVVLVTIAMMIGELLVGWWSGSMALTTDGWHMGTHAGALSLTALAYWYARTRANRDTFTFGTGKVYALAGYTSGVLLAVVAVWLAIEGVLRLAHPHTIIYGDALLVAVIGLIVNIGCALLLGHGTDGHDHDHGKARRAPHDHGEAAHANREAAHTRGEAAHAHDHDHDHDHDHGHGGPAHHHVKAAKSASPASGARDHNLRAAYLHIVADAVTSVLAIGALLLGRYAGLSFLDPLMGVVGGGIILWWAVGLCIQASHQLLDAATSRDLETWVRSQLEAIDDVKVADLHVWELGPGQHGCVVSLVTAKPREVDHYRRAVLGSASIAHLTVELHGCGRQHLAAS
jgi:cation diffusion facilitator family transporter